MIAILWFAYVFIYERLGKDVTSGPRR